MPGLLTPRLAFAFALSALAATTPCSCIEPPCYAGPVDSVQQWTDLDGDGLPELLMPTEDGYVGLEPSEASELRELYAFDPPQGLPRHEVSPLEAASGSAAQSAAYLEVSRFAFSDDTGGEEEPSFDDLSPQIWAFADDSLQRLEVPDVGASHQVVSVAFASPDGRTGVLMMGPVDWALGIRDGASGAHDFVVFEAPARGNADFTLNRPALVPLENAPDRLAFLSHGRQLVYTDIDLASGDAEHVVMEGHQASDEFSPGMAWTHPALPGRFLVREDDSAGGLVLRSCTTDDWNSGLSTCEDLTLRSPAGSATPEIAYLREPGQSEPSVLVMRRCEDLTLLRGPEEVTLQPPGSTFYLDVRDLDGDGADELVFDDRPRTITEL